MAAVAWLSAMAGRFAATTDDPGYAPGTKMGEARELSEEGGTLAFEIEKKFRQMGLRSVCAFHSSEFATQPDAPRIRRIDFDR